MSRPPEELNFCRVFELPDHYPEGFLFGGGKPVQMLMVDWFNPWPPKGMFHGEPKRWEDVKRMLHPWLLEKRYVRPGRKYILITDFGESMCFEKSP